jgi:hypothetical protein
MAAEDRLMAERRTAVRRRAATAQDVVIGWSTR